MVGGEKNITNTAPQKLVSWPSQSTSPQKLYRNPIPVLIEKTQTESASWTGDVRN